MRVPTQGAIGRHLPGGESGRFPDRIDQGRPPPRTPAGVGALLPGLCRARRPFFERPSALTRPGRA